jgi:hypothetical protein
MKDKIFADAPPKKKILRFPLVRRHPAEMPPLYNSHSSYPVDDEPLSQNTRRILIAGGSFLLACIIKGLALSSN